MPVSVRSLTKETYFGAMFYSMRLKAEGETNLVDYLNKNGIEVKVGDHEYSVGIMGVGSYKFNFTTDQYGRDGIKLSVDGFDKEKNEILVKVPDYPDFKVTVDNTGKIIDGSSQSLPKDSEDKEKDKDKPGAPGDDKKPEIPEDDKEDEGGNQQETGKEAPKVVSAKLEKTFAGKIFKINMDKSDMEALRKFFYIEDGDGKPDKKKTADFSITVNGGEPYKKAFFMHSLVKGEFAFIFESGDNTGFAVSADELNKKNNTILIKTEGYKTIKVDYENPEAKEEEKAEKESPENQNQDINNGSGSHNEAEGKSAPKLRTVEHRFVRFGQPPYIKIYFDESADKLLHKEYIKTVDKGLKAKDGSVIIKSNEDETLYTYQGHDMTWLDYGAKVTSSSDVNGREYLELTGSKFKNGINTVTVAAPGYKTVKFSFKIETKDNKEFAEIRSFDSGKHDIKISLVDSEISETD